MILNKLNEVNRKTEEEGRGAAYLYCEYMGHL